MAARKHDDPIPDETRSDIETLLEDYIVKKLCENYEEQTVVVTEAVKAEAAGVLKKLRPAIEGKSNEIQNHFDSIIEEFKSEHKQEQAGLVSDLVTVLTGMQDLSKQAGEKTEAGLLAMQSDLGTITKEMQNLSGRIGSDMDSRLTGVQTELGSLHAALQALTNEIEAMKRPKREPMPKEAMSELLRQMTERMDDSLYEVLCEQKEALLTGMPQPDPFRSAYRPEIPVLDPELEERDRELLRTFQKYLYNSEQNLERRIKQEFSVLFDALKPNLPASDPPAAPDESD